MFDLVGLPGMSVVRSITAPQSLSHPLEMPCSACACHSCGLHAHSVTSWLEHAPLGLTMFSHLPQQVVVWWFSMEPRRLAPRREKHHSGQTGRSCLWSKLGGLWIAGIPLRAASGLPSALSASCARGLCHRYRQPDWPHGAQQHL